MLCSITGKDQARKYKAENFDFCTFSGIFHTRNKDGLLQSDLLCIDFDHVTDIPSLHEKLLKDPCFDTELLFRSPSGDGLKWIIQQFPMSWDTNKNLSNELKSKEGIISSKDVEIRGLRAKVTSLTEEVNGLKYRLTLIDENAVERLRNAKNAETSRADKAESELDSLLSAYHNLLRKWNALWMEPEYNEAARKVKERKEREARFAAEKQARYQNILNRFIAEGRVALRAFALSNRTNFNDKEAASIYYGIMAVAHKMDLSLGTKEGIILAVNNFLDGMSWRDCSKFNKECVTNWTHLFAERDVTYEPSIIDNFISFVDYMSCNAETYTSLGGSNGCADQLTNWDGTKKLGLGSPSKKKGQSY